MLRRRKEKLAADGAGGARKSEVMSCIKVKPAKPGLWFEPG
jgi:hypothetical protein